MFPAKREKMNSGENEIKGSILITNTIPSPEYAPSFYQPQQLTHQPQQLTHPKPTNISECISCGSFCTDYIPGSFNSTMAYSSGLRKNYINNKYLMLTYPMHIPKEELKLFIIEKLKKYSKVVFLRCSHDPGHVGCVDVGANPHTHLLIETEVGFKTNMIHEFNIPYHNGVSNITLAPTIDIFPHKKFFEEMKTKLLTFDIDKSDLVTFDTMSNKIVIIEDYEIWIRDIYMSCERINLGSKPLFTITPGFVPHYYDDDNDDYHQCEFGSKYKVEKSEKKKIRIMYDSNGSYFKKFKMMTNGELDYKSFLIVDCTTLNQTSIQTYISKFIDIDWNGKTIIFGNCYDIDSINNILGEAYSSTKLCNLKGKPLEIYNVWVFSSNLQHINCNKDQYHTFVVDAMDNKLIYK